MNQWLDSRGFKKFELEKRHPKCKSLQQETVSITNLSRVHPFCNLRDVGSISMLMQKEKKKKTIIWPKFPWRICDAEAVADLGS